MTALTFQKGLTTLVDGPFDDTALSVARLRRQENLSTGTIGASGHFGKIVPTIMKRPDEGSWFGGLAL
jgi:hypothetical protein